VQAAEDYRLGKTIFEGSRTHAVAAVRTSRQRVLYELPPAGSHKNRK